MKVGPLLIVVLPLLGSACAERPLPVASGPLRPMNTNHWTPGPNELTTATAAGKTGP